MTTLFGLVGFTATASSDSLPARWLTSTLVTPADARPGPAVTAIALAPATAAIANVRIRITAPPRLLRSGQAYRVRRRSDNRTAGATRPAGAGRPTVERLPAARSAGT